MLQTCCKPFDKDIKIEETSNGSRLLIVSYVLSPSSFESHVDLLRSYSTFTVVLGPSFVLTSFQLVVW